MKLTIKSENNYIIIKYNNTNNNDNDHDNNNDIHNTNSLFKVLFLLTEHIALF